MWAKYFFQEQSKTVKASSKIKRIGDRIVIEQDNTSAIQMERHGKRSCTKRTKHIQIRYFYITEVLNDKTKQIQVVYRPTTEMSSDFHTKGLQGKLFMKHRDTLMGKDPKGGMFYQCYKSNKDKLG